MVRVKRGTSVRKRHKKVIKQAKGYRGVRKSAYSHAKIAVMKAGTNAYKDRRNKKRTFRRLWNVRINGAVRGLGMNYSRFINALYVKRVALNRKVLSNMAISHPKVFENVVTFVKK